MLAGDGSAKEQPSKFRSGLHNQIQKHPTCNPTCKYHGFLSIASSLNKCFEERISPQMQSGQDFNNPFTNHPHYPPHTHRGGAGGPPNSTHPPTPTGGGTLPLGVGGGPPRTWLIYISRVQALWAPPPTPPHGIPPRPPRGITPPLPMTSCGVGWVPHPVGWWRGEGYLLTMYIWCRLMLRKAWYLQVGLYGSSF